MAFINFALKMPISSQRRNIMDAGKTFFEIYSFLPYLAKHTVSAIVLSIFEDLESSGKPITPESIEAALRVEHKHFSSPSKNKKVS